MHLTYVLLGEKRELHSLTGLWRFWGFTIQGNNFLLLDFLFWMVGHLLLACLPYVVLCIHTVLDVIVCIYSYINSSLVSICNFIMTYGVERCKMCDDVCAIQSLELCECTRLPVLGFSLCTAPKGVTLRMSSLRTSDSVGIWFPKAWCLWRSQRRR